LERPVRLSRCGTHAKRKGLRMAARAFKIADLAINLDVVHESPQQLERGLALARVSDVVELHADKALDILELSFCRLCDGFCRRRSREELCGFAEERLLVPYLQRTALHQIETLLGVCVVGGRPRLPQRVHGVEGILLGGAQLLASAREDNN